MKQTAVTVARRKSSGSKLVMVTAYDATFASLVDHAGVDLVLVGDSVGMVVQGHKSTVPVTLDQMVYHTACVARGTRQAMVVADMPFMTYKGDAHTALQNAGRLVQDGGAEAVKLEGGHEIAENITCIVEAGIPVMGHIGLTPQSVHTLGGFKGQGRTPHAAEQLARDAQAIARAGAFALVLEGIPAPLAKRITHELEIPTIGIGAGADCDGQVLVCYDLLGMNPDFQPKFLKTFANLHQSITDGLSQFKQEVQDGRFPAAEHSTTVEYGSPTPAQHLELAYARPH